MRNGSFVPAMMAFTSVFDFLERGIGGTARKPLRNALRF
jgi:hypothetical protein